MKGFRKDGTPRTHKDGSLFRSALIAQGVEAPERKKKKPKEKPVPYRPPIEPEPEETDLEDEQVEEEVKKSLAEIQSLAAQREAKALDKVQGTEPRALTPEDVAAWMRKTPVRLAMRALTQILRYGGQDPKIVALKLEACALVLGGGDASVGKSKFNTLIGEVNVAIGQFVENQVAPMLPEGVNGDTVHDINALPGRSEVAGIPTILPATEGEQEQPGDSEGDTEAGGTE